MTFDQILPTLRAAQKVRRSYWDEGFMCLGVEDGRSVLLIIARSNGYDKTYEDCSLDAEDLMANDWEIVS